MKNVNVLIDGKKFFGTPMKNKEEAYEKIINMSKTSNCLTGNFWIMITFQSITE